MKTKISVVGCGRVAVGTALRLSASSSYEVVLYDASGRLMEGRWFDLESSGVIRGRSLRISESADALGTADSDVLILTPDVDAPADEALDRFAEAVGGVSRYSDNPIIVVSDDGVNPLCDVAQTVSGVPCRRVVGTGTLPDSARFSVLIGRECGIPAEKVSALAVGETGQSALPLIRFATVSGIPVLDLIEVDRAGNLLKRFRHPSLVGGSSDTAGGPLYGQVAAIERIVSAVGLGNVDLIPCTVFLSGEYDLEDLFLSVPAVVGPQGVDSVVELNLSVDELVPLRVIAAAARERRSEVAHMSAPPGHYSIG